MTVIQFAVPDHLRGRIMGIWMIVYSGSVPLGALWTGRAAQSWGVGFRDGSFRPALRFDGDFRRGLWSAGSSERCRGAGAQRRGLQTLRNRTYPLFSRNRTYPLVLVLRCYTGAASVEINWMMGMKTARMMNKTTPPRTRMTSGWIKWPRLATMTETCSS